MKVLLQKQEQDASVKEHTSQDLLHFKRPVAPVGQVR
jgi:hypothetical protein